jgi:hypothetical protein
LEFPYRKDPDSEYGAQSGGMSFRMRPAVVREILRQSKKVSLAILSLQG